MLNFFTHQACALTTFMAFALSAHGQPLDIELVGGTDVVDSGYAGVSHRITVTNRGTAQLVIVSVNGTRLGPPDFEAIRLMKGPPANWSLWRNVLGPGQSATVFVGRSPRGPGLFAVKAKVVFSYVNETFAARHLRQVVESGASSPQRIVYGQGLPEQRPVWVTYETDKLRPSDIEHSERSWTVKVSPDPVIAGLKKPGHIKRFRAVPVIGHIVERRKGLYRVEGSTLVPLGRSDFNAMARFGLCLQSGTCSVKALEHPNELPKGLRVSSEVNRPLFTSRIRPLAHVTRWIILHVTHENWLAFLDRVIASNWTLRYDTFDGLVLVTDPRLLRPKPMHTSGERVLP